MCQPVVGGEVGDHILEAHAHSDSINTVIINTVENSMQRDRKGAWISLKKYLKAILINYNR